jgi:hypothetical protein
MTKYAMRKILTRLLRSIKWELFFHSSVAILAAKSQFIQFDRNDEKFSCI